MPNQSRLWILFLWNSFLLFVLQVLLPLCAVHHVQSHGGLRVLDGAMLAGLNVDVENRRGEFFQRRHSTAKLFKRFILLSVSDPFVMMTEEKDLQVVEERMTHEDAIFKNLGYFRLHRFEYDSVLPQVVRSNSTESRAVISDLDRT